MATFMNTPADENDDEEELDQGLEPPRPRLDARPKNNLYAPGTGPGTGRTAIRVGTMNRDGSRSGLSPLGAATGPLTQKLPGLTAGATGPVTRAELQAKQGGGNGNANANGAGAGNDGLGQEPARLDARPKNNLYAPGTGPGTGRTAIRVGTMNRDGSRSGLSPLGAATGPLTQKLPGLTDDAGPPVPRLLRPRPVPSGFAQQWASENANAGGYARARREEGGCTGVEAARAVTHGGWKKAATAVRSGHADGDLKMGAGLNEGVASKTGHDLKATLASGVRIDGGDARFAEAVRVAMAEEAAESPVAAALQREVARLKITIQRKRKGLAETLTDKEGHTTIYYNPYARTGATMSHEFAHAIQQAAFHEVMREVEKSGRKPGAKDIERAIEAGRDALNKVVPVKCDRDRGEDYKENEAMRVSRIVNAERTATGMKGLPAEKRTAKTFWQRQGPQEGDAQHQDNRRPLPAGTEHGRYEHRYVKEVLGLDGAPLGKSAAAWER
jgi:hypothetical protein